MIVGGYIINAFAFIYINKKWNYLSYRNEDDEKLLFKVDQKKIILIAFFLAIVITILAIVLIITLELV